MWEEDILGKQPRFSLPYLRSLVPNPHIFFKDFIYTIYNFSTKAKLLLLKLIHLFAREVLLVKKLEIKETKTT